MKTLNCKKTWILEKPFFNETIFSLTVSKYLFKVIVQSIKPTPLIQVDDVLLLSVLSALNGFITSTHSQTMIYFNTPLKISEKRRFSDVFRGYRRGTLVENGLISPKFKFDGFQRCLQNPIKHLRWTFYVLWKQFTAFSH